MKYRCAPDVAPRVCTPVPAGCRLVLAGFTLVEVAIVLVIVGLILGGVFKGQELIDSARVRAMTNEMTGIRTAWYAFQDRYRAVAGDFARADVQIDANAHRGDGNGRIESPGERAGVWQQLALAGFIAGSFDGAGGNVGSAGSVSCTASTCPANPFSGFYSIAYGSQAFGANHAANELHTGDGVPVSVLARLDSRLDDGVATSGQFRVHRQFATACTRNGEWDVPAGNANCAAVMRE